jgi:CRISPR type II-A-associated protein Csn2
MIKFNFLDNIIEITDDFITTIEVENKKYFYRIIKNLYDIEKGILSENIVFFDENRKELNRNGKIKVYTNYFELQPNSNKVTNEMTKYFSNLLLEEDKLAIQKQYKKLVNLYKKFLNNLDIPLVVEENNSIDNILKQLKVSFNVQDNLLDNLLLILDIEHVFQFNDLLIFVNLKQYLNKVELIELYKYAIYNKVQILLIDSQSYGCTQNYEKKLIIDENLEEIVL